jgi:hypothetical protein
MHAIHHTEEYNQKNYGFVFSLWDRIFTKSFIPSYKGETFGVSSLSGSHNPFVIHIEPLYAYYKHIKTYLGSKV